MAEQLEGGEGGHGARCVRPALLLRSGVLTHAQITLRPGYGLVQGALEPGRRRLTRSSWSCRQLTMQAAVRQHYPQAHVSYNFTNRDKTPFSVECVAYFRDSVYRASL